MSVTQDTAFREENLGCLNVSDYGAMIAHRRQSGPRARILMVGSDYSSDADAWLNWAEATYAGAHTLFLSDNPFLWFSAAILGQQSLEMFLKAALIRKGHRIIKTDVWGHDLCVLARILINHGSAWTPEFMSELQRFTDYFNELRYPASLRKVEGLGQEHGVLLDALVEILRPFAVR